MAYPQSYPPLRWKNSKEPENHELKRETSSFAKLALNSVRGAAEPVSPTVEVVVDAPRHAALGASLTYASQRPLMPGTLVRVPLGKREVSGVVWDARIGDADAVIRDADDSGKVPVLRYVTGAADALTPLSAHWRALVEFAAGYAASARSRSRCCHRSCANWGPTRWPHA